MARFKKGDVLVPKGKKYPEWAVTVISHDKDGTIHAYPTGGGQTLRFSPRSAAQHGFRKVTKAEMRKPKFYKARFAIEDGPRFVGWTDGTLWNGWSKPLFERAEAMKVVRWINEESERFGGAVKAWFHAKKKTVVIQSTEHEEPDIVRPKTITAGGRRRKVWEIGQGWIWGETSKVRQ
jgi:hypothetical protein